MRREPGVAPETVEKVMSPGAQAAGFFVEEGAMGCRCAERRAVIAGAGRAAVTGDLSKIVPAASFVARTSREDLAALAGAAKTAFARAVKATRVV